MRRDLVKWKLKPATVNLESKAKSIVVLVECDNR